MTTYATPDTTQPEQIANTGDPIRPCLWCGRYVTRDSLGTVHLRTWLRACTTAEPTEAA